MIKLPLLVLSLAVFSLPANAQTNFRLLALKDSLHQEVPPCSVFKDMQVFATRDCWRFSLNTYKRTIGETSQASFGIQGPGIKEGWREDSLTDTGESERLRFQLSDVTTEKDTAGPEKHPAPNQASVDTSFKWRSALNQDLLILAVEHGYDLTQDKTRRELKGPFFKDYFRSVAGLGGWADGGKFFTNYLAHPMEGALYGFVQIQNDPKGKSQEFRRSREYWISRLKAMSWTAACSAQFEIGPLSQASIGNVGLHTDHTGKHKRKMAFVDLVVTPTIGTAWVVGEDILSRYVLQRFEKADNRFLRNTLRVILNPMRSAATIFRFKVPWHRDN
ncbi:MAG TPA: hypothetical protein VF762_06735 [Blastocatellia bacterium]